MGVSEEVATSERRGRGRPKTNPLPTPTPTPTSSAQISEPSKSSTTRGKKRKATEVVDLTTRNDPEHPKKSRKKALPPSSSSTTTIEKLEPPTKKKPTSRPQDQQDEEKRLKRYRPKCPTNVMDRMARARSQRMFVLKRDRDNSSPHPQYEDFDIAGTTGNIYTVRISHIPTCDCPDSGKNGTCKHILYVMMKVLKAPEELVYQSALLSSELEEIFTASPVPTEGGGGTGEGLDKGGGDARGRKPLEDDECPICYEEFTAGDKSAVYCKAQCGTNMHKTCFDQWVASKRGQTVTCVMCRTPWQYETGAGNLQEFATTAKVGNDGYRNIGAAARQQLGMNGRRDTSTYNEWWVRNKYEGGYYGGYY